MGDAPASSSLRSPPSTGWLPPSTSFSWSPSSRLLSLQMVCQRPTNATQNCSLSPRRLPQSRQPPSATSQAGPCGKRKRRALMVDSVTGQDTAIDFSGVTRTEQEESSPEVASTKDEEAREGKFLLYWMTTTSTSTTYTATTTVSSLACTPSGFTISNCTG